MAKETTPLENLQEDCTSNIYLQDNIISEVQLYIV